eukprot:GSMAST32.ASY1.ANO1.2645.1 assembled CDS
MEPSNCGVSSLGPSTSTLSAQGTSNNIEDSFPENYRGQLAGWSPALKSDNDSNKDLTSKLKSMQLSKSELQTTIPDASFPAIPVMRGQNSSTSQGSKKTKKNRGTRAPPPGGYPKKPKLTKAERRAIQEAQRAEKAAKRGGKQKPNKSTSNKESKTKASHSQGKKRDAKVVPLFSHLQQFDHSLTGSRALGIHCGEVNVHPAVQKVGLLFADRKITGANARCVAMFHAFRCFISDYRPPMDSALCRDLVKMLTVQMDFLVRCRHHSVSMGNAVKWLKQEISTSPPEMPDEDAKSILCEKISAFIEERITVASSCIVNVAKTKILDGDVVVTFGRVPIVEQTLIAARLAGRTFRVVVIDARPCLAGKSLVSSLLSEGISCTYVMVSATSYVMKQATKVIMGCESVFSNGAVLGRSGTASVAMTAHFYNVPVLFCCETYKFCERV